MRPNSVERFCSSGIPYTAYGTDTSILCCVSVLQNFYYIIVVLITAWSGGLWSY